MGQKVFDLTFSARRIGAIGVPGGFSRRIVAENPDAARISLYSEFEHVTITRCVDVTSAVTLGGK